MKTAKSGHGLAKPGQSKCGMCGTAFAPIVEGQLWCSKTCCKAMKDTDELERVYAALDELHRLAWEAQKSGKAVLETAK